jgi:hypothetical protein
VEGSAESRSVILNSSVNCQDYMASVVGERNMSVSILTGENEVLEENAVRIPLCSPQIPIGVQTLTGLSNS